MSDSTPKPALAVRRLLSGTEFSLLLAIAGVIAVTILLDPSRSFLVAPWQNLTDLLHLGSLLGIFALGAAVVIIAGGIDLSSGSVIAFAGTICASILLACAPLDDAGLPDTRSLPMWSFLLAIFGTLVVGVLIGTFHAWLITVIGLPPFVATLASLVGLRSLAKVLIQDVNLFVTGQGDDTQINIYSRTFRMFGAEWWCPLLVFLVLSAILWVIMNRTKLGRHLYAMGGNEEAARLSGIRTERLKWIAYCIGSVTASIAGILYTAYISKAEPATQGMGYELNAIAAAVVGGTSLAGGVGTIVGVMLGAMFLRVVIASVGKTVTARPDDLEGLIVGLLVVLAVSYNELRGSALWKKPFFPGRHGIATVITLVLLSGTVCLVMSDADTKPTAFWIGTGVAGLLFGGKAFLERRTAPVR